MIALPLPNASQAFSSSQVFLLHIYTVLAKTWFIMSARQLIIEM